MRTGTCEHAYLTSNPETLHYAINCANIHSVTESAEVPAETAWDRRRGETTRALVHLARVMTADRGLAGFTIEELCSEAAVSRRTFFNYFASKDDAVLGIPLDRSDAAAVARFLAGGAGDGEISPSLITDLAVLNEERWRTLEIAPDTAAELFAAVEQEPKLLHRMREHGMEQERFDVRLIEEREGLVEGDLRAEIAAHLIGALARAATAEYLRPGNSEPFVTLFERRLIAARDIFTTQSTTLEVLPR